ncbi:MAG: NADH-quinone oxidoreductase subunit NuoH [Dehalococcoidia bacterium]
MCNEFSGGLIHFCNIYSIFDSFLPENLDWMAFMMAAISLAFAAVNVVVMATALYILFERRVLARFQARLGPNRWGPFGIFQPIADLIKIITKEDTTTDIADKIVHNLAPIIFLSATLAVIAVIPLGNNSFLGKLNVGVLYIVAITSVNVVAIIMAGWADGNKYSMLGAMRGVAMLISYEIPMGLAIVGVILMSGTMSLSGIVEAQQLPFLLVQPLGFLIFLIASVAEMSRAPFDQIEAESELGAGYHTEYSGMKFGIFQLAEFMAPLITGIVVTTLFLGGFRGWSWLPGELWFLIKVFSVVFVLLWIRATWPRIRFDQIMAFSWKALLALAFLNIILLVVEIEIFQDNLGSISLNSLILMGAINWVVTIVSIVFMANALGQSKLKRPKAQPSSLANMYAESE